MDTGNGLVLVGMLKVRLKPGLPGTSRDPDFALSIDALSAYFRLGALLVEHEPTPPLSVVRTMEWLSGLLRPAPVKPDESKRHGVILIDESGKLDTIAKELLKKLLALNLTEMQYLAFRIGQRRPTAFAPNPRLGSGLVLPVLDIDPRRPPLIAPLLDGLRPDNVAFIVLLAQAPPLDLVDVEEEHPAEGLAYFDPARSQVRLMNWEVVSRFDSPYDAAAEIARQLQPLLEGDALCFSSEQG